MSSSSFYFFMAFVGTATFVLLAALALSPDDFEHNDADMADLAPTDKKRASAKPSKSPWLRLLSWRPGAFSAFLFDGFSATAGRARPYRVASFLFHVVPVAWRVKDMSSDEALRTVKVRKQGTTRLNLK